MDAPDGDCRTLHIRCGSDIFPALRTAGFTGDLLEYADPICQGPVPEGPNLLATRAHFISSAYRPITPADLQAAEDRLAEAHTYPRAVLWFEHDSYDQLLLARILARFATGPRPERLELICIDHHPSVPRFIGLGQLDATALAALWPDRVPVTNTNLTLGRDIWTALRQPDPTALQAIAETAPPIPANAIRRHLQELPGTGDGLSLTQRLILGLLAQHPTTAGRIFAELTQRLDPLPFLGDLMLLPIVNDMAQAGVLTLAAHDKPFTREATITDTGRAVLAGHRDYLALTPPERWVGGVRVGSGWRWDTGAGRVAAV
jgi:hypothetical protein